MAAATLPTPSAASPEREEQEYFLLYDAFARLLDCWTDSAARYSALETLIEMRAGTLIERLLDGLGLDLEQALEILKRRNDFPTQQERERRDILAAGIENMLDFAAAEEYAMCCDLPEKVAEDDYEFCDAVFERYNGHRAVQENLDVEYAAVMAAWWLTVGTEQMLTFTTQGDERVRPWHAALEGASYPKSSFPAELIPPIEYGCRCFLTPDSQGAVTGVLELPEGVRINPVFRESLCHAGRIFSAAHPYFRHPLPSALHEHLQTLKRKFHLSWT